MSGFDLGNFYEGLVKLLKVYDIEDSQTLREEIKKSGLKNETKENLNGVLDDLDKIMNKNEKNIINQKNEGFDTIDKILEDPITKTSKTFKDVIGLEEAKDIARSNFIYPLDENYASLNIEPSNSMLLYGPPGTGKTLFANAIVGEINELGIKNIDFYSIESSQFKVSYVGKTEQNLAYFFKRIREMIDDDKEKKIIIFIDEFDSIAKSRKTSEDYDKSIVNTLLIEWNKIKKDEYKRIFLLFATNFPKSLDDSVISRIDDMLYIKLPSDEERREQINKFFNDKSNHNLVNKKLREFIINKTDKCSSRTIGIYLESLKRASKIPYFKAKKFRKSVQYTYMLKEEEEKKNIKKSDDEKYYNFDIVDNDEHYIYCDENEKYENICFEKDDIFEKEKENIQNLFFPVITEKDVFSEFKKLKHEDASEHDDFEKGRDAIIKKDNPDNINIDREKELMGEVLFHQKGEIEAQKKLLELKDEKNKKEQEIFKSTFNNNNNTKEGLFQRVYNSIFGRFYY